LGWDGKDEDVDIIMVDAANYRYPSYCTFDVKLIILGD
jgi:hypothetical protein